MIEWTQTNKKLPKEGKYCDILVTGRVVERVLFANGRFWKVRKTYGGHVYEPVAWRYSDAPVKKGGRSGKAASDASTESE